MELWLLYAAGAAVFAALTTVLAKIGIKDVDSHLATAIRTVVVLAFAWLMVFVTGAHGGIFYIQGWTWVFLILSGLATGGSWLCFFRALKLGSINKVVPIDKSSTMLTMLLAFIILGEAMRVVTVGGMILMGMGTWLMLELGKGDEKNKDEANSPAASQPAPRLSKFNLFKPRKFGWLFFAIAAAVLASMVAIIGKVGVADMDASLWTAARTVIVVPLSWLMVAKVGSHKTIKQVTRKSWTFLILSGVATGVSWLFFYHALQHGDASRVVPIDRLSVLLTMLFARLVLGERFSRRSVAGLVLLTVGTLLPVVM
ncbi:MAG: EamA family transporter [Defluviitaleaceae bacterium]|nr:EamA family transporter [Defluviitaleaceae bacterium]